MQNGNFREGNFIIIFIMAHTYTAVLLSTLLTCSPFLAKIKGESDPSLRLSAMQYVLFYILIKINQ
jgi:hypothetical protein